MKNIDDTIRDRIISRLIDAHETLSVEDIELIKSDRELRDIYDAATLCKEAYSMDNANVPDVEAELKRFKKIHRSGKIMYFRPILRIAAIFAGILIAAIGITAALNPKILYFFRESDPVEDITELHEISTGPITGNNETVTPVTNKSELLYDNVSLDSITQQIGRIYDVKVVFNNDMHKDLRLYMRIPEGKTINDVIAILNTFEYFKIHIENDTLVII